MTFILDEDDKFNYMTCLESPYHWKLSNGGKYKEKKNYHPLKYSYDSMDEYKSVILKLFF